MGLFDIDALLKDTGKELGKFGRDVGGHAENVGDAVYDAGRDFGKSFESAVNDTSNLSIPLVLARGTENLDRFGHWVVGGEDRDRANKEKRDKRRELKRKEEERKEAAKARVSEQAEEARAATRLDQQEIEATYKDRVDSLELQRDQQIDEIDDAVEQARRDRVLKLRQLKSDFNAERERLQNLVKDSASDMATQLVDAEADIQTVQDRMYGTDDDIGDIGRINQRSDQDIADLKESYNTKLNGLLSTYNQNVALYDIAKEEIENDWKFAVTVETAARDDAIALYKREDALALKRLTAEKESHTVALGELERNRRRSQVEIIREFNKSGRTVASLGLRGGSTAEKLLTRKIEEQRHVDDTIAAERRLKEIDHDLNKSIINTERERLEVDRDNALRDYQTNIGKLADDKRTAIEAIDEKINGAEETYRIGVKELTGVDPGELDPENIGDSFWDNDSFWGSETGGAYGSDLRKIQQLRDDSVRGLERELSDLQTAYDRLERDLQTAHDRLTRDVYGEFNEDGTRKLNEDGEAITGRMGYLTESYASSREAVANVWGDVKAAAARDRRYIIGEFNDDGTRAVDENGQEILGRYDIELRSLNSLHEITLERIQGKFGEIDTAETWGLESLEFDYDLNLLGREYSEASRAYEIARQEPSVFDQAVRFGMIALNVAAL